MQRSSMRLGRPVCSTPVRLLASLFVLATVLGALAGCGGSSKRDPIDEDTVDIILNDAPVAAYTSITVNGGLIEVCFLLRDQQSDLVDVTPEFSLDGGISFRPATERLGPPSEGPVSLTAAPGGVLHCFVWDSGADGIGFFTPTTVLFRLIPFDNKDAGPPAVSGPIVIFNPLLTVDLGSDSGLFGTVGLQIPVTLNTGGTAPAHVSVTVDFDASLLALNATPATVGPSGTTAGALLTFFNISTGRIRIDLDAPVAMTDGVIADLFFDSITPGGAAATATPITCVSVVASDVGSVGIGAGCGISGSIFLLPNLPPSCAVTSPLAGAQLTTITGFTGNVQVGYTLLDAESDLVDINVEYTTDAGATWQPATEAAGPPSQGTLALATSPAGINHIFTWDADLDIPTLTMAANIARVRITPSDSSSGQAGTLCESASFTIDLRNAPPTCVQPITVTGMSGNVVITFDVDDLEMDLVDILFEYESPPGSGFVSATAAGISMLPNPSLSVTTPAPGLSFTWDTTTDLGAVVTMANFRITVGDPFNPLFPPAAGLSICDAGGPFPIDNTACVFNSLRVLGPGTMLGSVDNIVGGGPMHSDPCTINANFTFSLGGPNRGPLTSNQFFSTGGNPLVFSDTGQSLTIVAEGTFSGVCAGLMNVTSDTTAVGSTTYAVVAGPGGPYVSSMGNGMFTSLTTAPVAQGGCDRVDVTFTPNGLGMSGGSNGMPVTVSFAACLDYFGWDDASRNGMSLMPDGAFDASMIGTPSGMAPPGAGGTSFIGVYGKCPPTTTASAFDMNFTYDSAFMVPDQTYGNSGADNCPAGLGTPWTITPNPMLMGMDVFLVNGFRITMNMGSIPLATLAWTHVGAGNTSLVGRQVEWANNMAMRIPGPQPLPWVNPGMCSGFRMP